MDIPKLVKSNRGLLTGTALLCLGSVVAGACGANPVLGLITNVTAGLAGDNFGKFAERCGESGDVLRNQDLARAAGRTIGWTLLEKVSPDYPNMKKQLDKLAKKIEDYWLAWEEQQESEENFNLFEGLHEDQLVQIFSQQPDQFTEYQVLESSEWQAVVRWLFEQGCQDKILKGDLAEYEPVIGALARELELHFNQNLRSVLKDDATNNGGKAFAGMLLDLHGATIAKIENIQAYLPQLATREDICQALQKLEGFELRISSELVKIRQTLLEQYIDQNKPRLPLPQECEYLITDKTKDFVGRDYVFRAILDFLEKQPKGYFVLEADPGVGKTAIMARCVQIFGGHCLTHFNIQSQGIVKVNQFLQNICTQLIDYYQLDYPTLPENTEQDGNVFAKLLGEASKKLSAGKKLVVVVDALDEVDSSEQTKGSNILYLPDALPNNVYFILSKRPQQLYLPQCDEQTHFDLMQYPAESAEDAGFYVEKRWQASENIRAWVEAKNSTLEAFKAELVGKSENNFMYLRYVLNDIHDGSYASESLDTLPQGLRRYYQKHWGIMGMNSDPLPVDKICTIYVLSEVREPVSRRLLAKLTEIDEATLAQFLRKWQQFLRSQRVGKENRYTIYHASFSDFLNEQAEESGVNLEDINRRIAENLTQGAPK